jgi:Ca2+-binding RTX toxin-like protein
MSTRRTGLIAPPAAALGVVIVLTSGSAPAAHLPTCFGKPATIIAHKHGRTHGTNGNDVIVGTRGGDFIDPRRGRDRVCGRSGKDVLRDGWGRKRRFIRGGPGDDYLSPGGAAHALVGPLVLKGDMGDDYLGGGASGCPSCPRPVGDDLWGGPGDDELNGDGGPDNLDGGDGVDSCDGDYPGFHSPHDVGDTAHRCEMVEDVP